MANPVKNQKWESMVQDLIAKVKANVANGKGSLSVSTTIPKEALPNGYSEDDYFRLLANVTLFGVHRWYIGHADLPDETKVDWNGLYCRRHWLEFEGVLSHPDLDTILSDVNDCMGAAGAAAIAAGLLTGNVAAATAAFKASLYGCLQVKGIGWAQEIGVWIDTKELRGDWHYCL